MTATRSSSFFYPKPLAYEDDSLEADSTESKSTHAQIYSLNKREELEFKFLSASDILLSIDTDNAGKYLLLSKANQRTNNIRVMIYDSKENST